MMQKDILLDQKDYTAKSVLRKKWMTM